MTTEEALERLRPDWALSRDDDYETDAPGWAVHSLMNGEYYQRLGWGVTVLDAIEMAESKVAQDEIKDAERRTDYERRKAAGQLTEWERLSEATAAIWTTSVIRQMQTPTVLSQLINRSFEGAGRQGDTISIRKHDYVTVKEDE